MARRLTAFAVSLFGHVALIALLLVLESALPSENSLATRYVVERIPLEKARVIWYPSRNQVPEVTPERRFGPSPTPTGQVDTSGQVLIARSAEPASAKQVIRQPDPEPIPHDVPAPNLV